MLTGHSFGGHAMDRYLLDLETAPEGEPAAAAPEGDPIPAGEPAAAAVAGVEPAAEGAPSPEPVSPAAEPTPAGIDWNDPAVREQAAPYVEQQVLATLERLAAAQHQPAEAPPLPDPFSDTYADDMEAYMNWKVEQRMATVQPVLDHAQAQQAQEWTDQTLDKVGVPKETADEIGPDGVPTREAVLFFAGGVEQAAKESGLQLSGEQILQHAWKQLETWAGRRETAAVERYKQTLNTIDGAPTTPQPGAPVVEGLPDDDDELAAARRLIARR